MHVCKTRESLSLYKVGKMGKDLSEERLRCRGKRILKGKDSVPTLHPQVPRTLPLRAEASKRIVSAGRTNRSDTSNRYARPMKSRTRPRKLRSASIARRLRAHRARREKEAK